MPRFSTVSPLRIDREVRQNCQIFYLDGIFDLFSVPTFRGVLEPYIAQSPHNLILDFTWVDPIDSYALGELVDLGKTVERHGGTLQTIGSSRLAQMILRLRLEQVLALQSSVDRAIENLESF